MFIAALFAIARTWKKSKCPLMEKWIKKMTYTHIIEYCSFLKKNGIMPFEATGID